MNAADRMALDAIELDGTSGEFEMGEDGYLRFYPSDETRKKIEAYLYDEITRAKEDHKDLFADAIANLEAYKGKKIRIDGSGEQSILPSPLVRIPCDQIISSTVNTVLRARPLVSLDACFPAEYEVPVQIPVPREQMAEVQAMGVPLNQPFVIKVNAEQVARRLQQGLEYKLRNVLDFATFIWTIVTDCVTVGKVPAWAKVCRHAKERPLVEPKVNGVSVDLKAKTRRYVDDGEEVTFYSVPGVNVLLPIDEDDQDESPWLAESVPCSPSAFLAAYYAGDYFLLDKKGEEGEEEAKKLSLLTSENADPQREKREATQDRVASVPRAQIEKYEVWFYWDLKVKLPDPENPEKTKPVVQRFSLMGDFHYGAKRLLSCFDNPYEHQKRIHVPCWQFKDPHSHAGEGTAGIVRWHQKVHTHAIHADIVNAHHADVPLYWYDPDGNPDTIKFFEGKDVVAPGEFIPGVEGKDWGRVRAGEGHNSLLQVAQYVAGSAQETSNVSAYESGQTIPGRTAAATVAQILEQGKQQPLLFLRQINNFVSKVIWLYLRTVRQFQPMGETLPIRSEELKGVVNLPFRLPVNEALDNFRITLTAADEAMAKEHEPEQIALLINAYEQHTKFATEVVGPMLQGTYTPAQMNLMQKIVEGHQELFDLILSSTRTDTDKFDLRPQLNAVVEEIEQMQKQMQEAQANAAAANQGAGPQGVVPGAEGAGVGGGLPGTDGQPPVAAGVGPAAAAGAPQ
jgi:hypothetical protein